MSPTPRNIDAAPEKPTEPHPLPVAAASETIQQVLAGWAAAWSSKDFPRYRGYYARDFAPGNGKSLEQWASERAVRLGKLGDISVGINDLKVDNTNPDKTITEFSQSVKLQCRPAIRHIEYRGAARASPSPTLRSALQAGRARALILCPSNPFLSIDPILAVPGLRQSLRDSGAPIVAVSPIVGGRAIKGPTAKIMRELGLSADVPAVAAHYRGLIDGLVIDGEDAGLQPRLREEGLQVLVTDTVMRSLADRMQLARDALDFAVAIAASPAPPVISVGRSRLDGVG